MIVSMWMTRDLVTVGPHTPISEVAALMAARRIRRLPVVGERDGLRLVGIVSAKDILHAFPPNVNPFAVLAPNAGLVPRTAGDIMSHNLRTATPETPIEEAARIMAQYKIGALPVVSHQRLVGLITESDIFRIFVDLLSATGQGARITFDLSTGEDVFRFISNAATPRKLHVSSLVCCVQNNAPVCVVRITGEAIDKFLGDLWESGHRVLNVVRFP